MAKKINKEPTRVNVEIYGVSYPLRTTESEEYVKNLAQMVNDKMNMVATSTGSFSGTRIAVIAALELADDYMKLKKDYDELMTLIDEK